MSSEYGKEERQQGVPYEPTGHERRQAAASIHAKLIEAIGGETFMRFSRFAGRYKTVIPRDEHLLQHTTFELLSSGMGFIHLRATVELPCSPPGEGILYQDPYVQTVDVYVSKAERMEAQTYADDRSDDPPVARNIQPDLRTQQQATSNIYTSIVWVAAAAAAIFGSAHVSKTYFAHRTDAVPKETDEHESARSLTPEIGPR